jgi:hypothetical protein
MTSYSGAISSMISKADRKRGGVNKVAQALGDSAKIGEVGGDD